MAVPARFGIWSSARWGAAAVALLSFLGAAAADDKLALDAPIPDDVPPGTVLAIGDPTTQRALEYSGEIGKLPFKVEWARITGGPATLDAFRAKALDVGSAADIPPIHATWVGVPVKIVAVRLRKDPAAHPNYAIAVAPGSGIERLEDLRGKRIAFSPGQAQGALVLRVLRKLGIDKKEVTLVELPATSDVYANALAARLVDVAPLGGALNVKKYLDAYAKDGAKAFPHGLIDDPGVLWVRTETLQDPAKAAAIKQYVKFWARAVEWQYAHRDEWATRYYVKDQGLPQQDAELVARSVGEPEIPADWSEFIERQQATIDLLAVETGRKSFDARTLFDRRFERVIAEAIALDKAAKKPLADADAAGSKEQ